MKKNCVPTDMVLFLGVLPANLKLRLALRRASFIVSCILFHDCLLLFWLDDSNEQLSVSEIVVSLKEEKT